MVPVGMYSPSAIHRHCRRYRSPSNRWPPPPIIHCCRRTVPMVWLMVCRTHRWHLRIPYRPHRVQSRRHRHQRIQWTVNHFLKTVRPLWLRAFFFPFICWLICWFFFSLQIHRRTNRQPKAIRCLAKTFSPAIRCFAGKRHTQVPAINDSVRFVHSFVRRKITFYNVIY